MPLKGLRVLLERLELSPVRLSMGLYLVKKKEKKLKVKKSGSPILNFQEVRKYIYKIHMTCDISFESSVFKSFRTSLILVFYPWSECRYSRGSLRC